jgi:hypothetical protein
MLLIVTIPYVSLKASLQVPKKEELLQVVWVEYVYFYYSKGFIVISLLFRYKILPVQS